MAGTVDKVQKAVGEQLGAGEQVLAATKAQVLGGSMKLAKQTGLFVGLGGMVGAAASAAVDRGADDVAKALASGATVAVTDRRLLVLSASKVSGGPKDLVIAVDRSQVTGVEEGSTRVTMVKLMTFTAHVTDPATGGTTPLAFEVPKVATKDAVAVVATLRG
jgi:hypothetical protein